MLQLVVRIWPHPEADVAEYEEFEREAASIMKAYDGRIERAFRVQAAPESDEPFEVHLVSFPDEAAFAAYRGDARTLALTERRERLIARTEIWRGAQVNYGF